MSMVVTNNISALKAHHNLSVSNRGMASSIEKLSSGYRINVGADDPSGLVISEQLRSQITGLNRAVRNTNEAYNLISIAEGALNEMNEILKKLRSLAIHAANTGVTSPEQVEADEAELDSGIQTLNRIANTTTYSDQMLLNGSKELVYNINTTVNDTGDHALLDASATRVDQIFKRDGMSISIGYTGYKTDYQANYNNSAQRAYLEADNAYSTCQIDGNNITATQKFILTGTSGSKQFSFPEGTSLGMMVSQINNSKDSTGVGAALIFASNVRIDPSTNGGTAPDYAAGTPSTGLAGFDDATSTYVYTQGDIQIYGADLNNASDAKIASATITPDAANAFVVGYNCDGDGKIYAKVVDVATNSIEYYKDKECTMLIGTGDAGFFSATNNSGIPSTPTHNMDGIFIELTDKAENLDVYSIAIVGQYMDNQKDMAVGSMGGWADLGDSVMSGVNLGVNTAAEGDLFFKYTPVTIDASGNVLEFKVEAFTDDSRAPQYLVASSGTVAAGASVPQTVRVESVTMANGKESGLNITLNVPSGAYTALPTGEQTGQVTFDNLGIRLYSTDYGSQESIRIQNQQGELFYYYRESNTLEKVMVKGETTVQIYGQDATVTMNGTSVLTNGLKANTTTADFSGSFVFNGGSLGLTTIAVAGYDVGSLYSKAQAMQAIIENESQIAKDERQFIPPSVNIDIPGLVDSQGYQVSLYLDFSDLDSSVLSKIDTLGTGVPISASYDDTTQSLSIDATGLSTGSMNIATIQVDVEKLVNGFYSTEADLKGLYLQTSAKISTDKSVAGTTTATIAAYSGNALTEVLTYATNPRTNTSETLTNFLGGMQFQLGGTSGDQDRTVYSIQSMDMANLGSIEYEGVKYSLQDVLSGGSASLSRDPVLSMRIVEQAIIDVSGLRARLGAFQANMLQTNINSLEVAIENITLTESAIRDTDMASEATEYTKNQILVQAGTSMLAQANSISQNVLSLLQG